MGLWHAQSRPFSLRLMKKAINATVRKGEMWKTHLSYPAQRMPLLFDSFALGLSLKWQKPLMMLFAVPGLTTRICKSLAITTLIFRKRWKRPGRRPGDTWQSWRGRTVTAARPGASSWACFDFCCCLLSWRVVARSSPLSSCFYNTSTTTNNKKKNNHHHHLFVVNLSVCIVVCI
ncbi:unnamed protein product [Heterosigma akashiwo]